MSKLIEKAKKEENENNLEVALTYYEMALSDPACPFDIRSDMGVVYDVKAVLSKDIIDGRL